MTQAFAAHEPGDTDHTGLEVIDREACFALLHTVSVGRVVFTAAALPAVLPLNFCVDDVAPGGTAILVKTSDNSRLATYASGNVVAFEADEFDVDNARGWSVVVTGRLEAITDPAEEQRVSGLGLTSWVPAPRDRFLRIKADLVSGRRIPNR